MVDSIQLFFFKLFPITLGSDGWDYHKKTDQFGVFTEWFEYSGDGFPTWVHIKYYPISLCNGRPLLIVDIGSVLKVVFGNNYQTTTNINLIVEKVNELLRSIPGLEKINAGKGILRRIDFCVNFQQGNLLPAWFKALSQIRLPRRRFGIFDNPLKMQYKDSDKLKTLCFNGIVWASNTVSTAIYAKEKECLDSNAAGLMRFELRLRGKKAIERYTNVANLVLDQVTPEMAKAAISYELNMLGLDIAIQSEQTVREQLIKKHGQKKGRTLFHTLMELKECPGLDNKSIATHLHISIATVRRLKKDLKDAGVSMVLGPISITLPGLVVEYQEDSCKIDQEVLSDTRHAIEPGTSVAIGSSPQPLVSNKEPHKTTLQRVLETNDCLWGVTRSKQGDAEISSPVNSANQQDLTISVQLLTHESDQSPTAEGLSPISITTTQENQANEYSPENSPVPAIPINEMGDAYEPRREQLSHPDDPGTVDGVGQNFEKRFIILAIENIPDVLREDSSLELLRGLFGSTADAPIRVEMEVQAVS